jgi:hypothetical protein
MHYRTHKSSSSALSSQEKGARFFRHTSIVQANQNSHKPAFQEEMENDTLAQNKFEAFGLQIKAKNNMITPETERLGVAQAKMENLLPNRVERAEGFSHSFTNIPLYSPGRPVSAPARPLLQLSRHGLVPPSTMGREFNTPENPQSSKGQREAVHPKDLTRSERMINRIGRILVQQENVHVAVALDGKALVLSANKEVGSEERRLDKIAAKLKSLINSEDQDPIGETSTVLKHENVPLERRNKDKNKIKKLLKGDYIEENGIELNEEVRKELASIKAAIEKGIISKEDYLKGEPGIYVIVTPENPKVKEYNMHGELKVTSAIKERRAKKNNIEEFKNVFIGGTWLDCFACNASHKIMNESLQKIKSEWQFYTAGTHGGMYEGYRVQQETEEGKEKFKELTGEDVKIKKISKVNKLIIPPQTQIADESESEDEDYEILKYDRKIEREKRKKGKNEEGTLETESENYRESVAKIDKEIQGIKRKLIEFQNNIDKHENLQKELKTKINHVVKIIEGFESEKTNLRKEGENTTEIDTYLESEKKSVEKKVMRQEEVRPVKWNKAQEKWEPIGWTPVGKSKNTLEQESKSTKSSITLKKQTGSKEQSERKNRLKNLEEMLFNWNKEQISMEEKIKILAQEYEIKMEEFKKEKTKIEEEEKVLMIKRSDIQKEFHEKYELSYKDVTRPIEERKKAREKMDSFQIFNED